MNKWFSQRFFLMIFLFLTGKCLLPQTELYRAKDISQPVFFYKTSPLRDMPVVKPVPDENDETGEVHNLNSVPWAAEKISASNPLFDLKLQSLMGIQNRGGINTHFEGVGNLQYKLPPDTEGDVGPDHYVQMVNMSFAVFDKSGNILYGPASNLSLWQQAPEPWSGFSNGDPIVLYDQEADRWLVSELSFPYHPYSPHYIKIAISETGDPTGSWYLYGFEYDYFCDYPKLGIWNDGYYLTTNNNYWVNNQWDFHAVGVSVFERDSMLVGSPDARRIFFDFYPNQQMWSVLPADFDGTPPPEGTPEYLACLKEGTPDRIFIYKVETDWQNVNNAALLWECTLLPEPFSGSLPDGISQPEGAPYLAPMSNRLLYRLQYRNFGNYSCMVTNHTVNRGDDVAGIRWYEFRDDGSGWEIQQQGTYSPDDTHRWMGSIAMDGYGNMALGYSASGSHVYPSIRYTGRTVDAAPGMMNLAEQVIKEGSGVQLNPNHRWGDYSSMSVDPTDQTTFWYTQQYYKVTGDRSWQTQIASLHINDYLQVSVTSGADTICVGDSVQLFANVMGGSGKNSFRWTSDPPGFHSTKQNPFVSPENSSTYSCLVNDGINAISGQTNIMMVYFSLSLPDSMAVYPSQEYAVPVILKNPAGHDIETLSMLFSYDDQIIGLTGASLAGGILDNNIYILQLDNSIPGQAGVSINAAGLMRNQSGVICHLFFTGIGLPDECGPVYLENAALNDSICKVDAAEICVYNCDNPYFLEISLDAGWNGISSWLAPVDPDMISVLDPVQQQLIFINNFSGYYWPEGGINTLQNWNYKAGFFIKASDDATLTISGCYPQDNSILLFEGWNLFPVLSENEVAIVDLFSNHLEKVEMIREAIGEKIYWPEKGIFSLLLLEPGGAYLVDMKGECMIRF
nr:hypothetical protein [Bacteroidota bacterium]